jgi:hypothetical protein
MPTEVSRIRATIVRTEARHGSKSRDVDERKMPKVVLGTRIPSTLSLATKRANVFPGFDH